MKKRRFKWRRERGALVSEPLIGDFEIPLPQSATCPAWPATPHREHVWASGQRRYTCPGTDKPAEPTEGVISA